MSEARGESLVRRGLEKLLESVDLELARVELELRMLCERLGLKSLDDLEKAFREGHENPEVDLVWPKYLYLKDKLERLRREGGDPRATS